MGNREIAKLYHVLDGLMSGGQAVAVADDNAAGSET